MPPNAAIDIAGRRPYAKPGMCLASICSATARTCLSSLMARLTACPDRPAGAARRGASASSGAWSVTWMGQVQWRSGAWDRAAERRLRGGSAGPTRRKLRTGARRATVHARRRDGASGRGRAAGYHPQVGGAALPMRGRPLAMLGSGGREAELGRVQLGLGDLREGAAGVGVVRHWHHAHAHQPPARQLAPQLHLLTGMGSQVECTGLQPRTHSHAHARTRLHTRARARTHTRQSTARRTCRSGSGCSGVPALSLSMTKRRESSSGALPPCCRPPCRAPAAAAAARAGSADQRWLLIIPATSSVKASGASEAAPPRPTAPGGGRPGYGGVAAWRRGCTGLRRRGARRGARRDA